MAAPWPELQQPDGQYRNWLGGYDRYGEAMLGYGLLKTGVRERRDSYVTAGLRSIAWAVTRPAGFRDRESLFENMAVAGAYNFVRRELPDHPIFRSNRAAWESFLRKVRPISTPYRVPDTSRYTNHYIVEAIGMLELFRTGLRSSRPAAALGGQRARTRAVTVRVLLSTIPRLASRGASRAAGARAFVLSDYPDDPLAYHGLSVGTYARALELLGGAATRRARGVLQQAARASWVLTAPDGASGYFGRSQEEAWSLAGAALGAEAAARARGSSAGWDRRFRAVAERSLLRLRDDYGVGDNGLFIVPALREGSFGVRGVDGSSVPSFAGLTLLLTEWALDEMDRGPRRAGSLAADRELRALLASSESRFAVVRRGQVWMAVRKTKSVDRANDLRYDFGLVAYKTPRDGRWADVLRIRPRRTFASSDSAGPLLRRGGATGLPFGGRIAVRRRGVVTIVGGFRTPNGRVLRRGVRFTFRPAGACVRMTVPARRGDRIEQSIFLRAGSGPRRVRARSLRDGDQSITASAPFRASVGGRYTSAVDAKLVRARLRFIARRSSRIEIAICPS